MTVSSSAPIFGRLTKCDGKAHFKREFDHGRTRRRGAALSDAPYFVMMTDDALPADEFLLERLLTPLFEKKAQMSYARQLPDENCGIIERFTRSFNYPKQSVYKTKADLQKMGIKAFFASNVCAAYEREAYEKAGGFVKHTIFNEDMIFARGLLDMGGCICYAADACVVHSHNYSGSEQFKRNFDLGVSHAEYADVFSGLKTEGEGLRLVKMTVKHLLKYISRGLFSSLFGKAAASIWVTFWENVIGGCLSEW